MSLYFLLGTLSAEGQKLVHDDRDLMVKSTRGIQIRGAEILGQYAVLGRYDFVMMVEADDNDSVARLSLEIGVRTGLHMETLPAIAIGFLSENNPQDPSDRPESVHLSPGSPE